MGNFRFLALALAILYFLKKKNKKSKRKGGRTLVEAKVALAWVPENDGAKLWLASTVSNFTRLSRVARGTVLGA